MEDLFALLVVRSLSRGKRNDTKIEKKLNRKFKRMLQRRRKIKNAMIRKNSTTANPETTTYRSKDENWYSYVDFLREEKVL